MMFSTTDWSQRKEWIDALSVVVVVAESRPAMGIASDSKQFDKHDAIVFNDVVGKDKLSSLLPALLLCRPPRQRQNEVLLPKIVFFNNSAILSAKETRLCIAACTH